LEPCEFTTSVNIKKIGPWWLAYVESNIIEPAKVEIYRQLILDYPFHEVHCFNRFESKGLKDRSSISR